MVLARGMNAQNTGITIDRDGLMPSIAGEERKGEGWARDLPDRWALRNRSTTEDLKIYNRCRTEFRRRTFAAQSWRRRRATGRTSVAQTVGTHISIAQKKWPSCVAAMTGREKKCLRDLHVVYRHARQKQQSQKTTKNNQISAHNIHRKVLICQGKM